MGILISTFGPVSAILLIVAVLFGIHKLNTDEHMFYRWRMKFRRWSKF